MTRNEQQQEAYEPVRLTRRFVCRFEKHPAHVCEHGNNYEVGGPYV